MATVSANRHAVMDLDRTMRDESMRDSGDESDVLDNIVFKRPVTRRMSKAAASSTPLTSPVRRRSPRKSSSSSTASLPRPRSSRRSSQATTTSSQSSSSQPQSQSQSQSQTEPQTIVEEPTGMSQELAQVSVASQEPGMEDAGSRSEEPVQGTSHFDDPLRSAETDSAPVATDEGGPLTSVTVDANAGAGQTDTDARSTAPVLVFDTEPRLEPASQTRESKSNRTLLALPVFAVAEETPPAPMVAPDTEDTAPVLPGLDDSTVLSIETPSLSFDTSIPTTTSSASTSISSIPLPEPPHVEYTPRRSARLSGISVTSTVSSISASPAIFHPVKIGPKLITSTRQTRTKGKAKAPALDTTNGPTDMTSTLFDSTIFTTINKGKEKERVLSPSPSLSPPPVLLSDPKPDVTAPFKPPKLRSLSPESDAVLMSLHQALQPQPPPALQPLSKSSDRPAPLPSAMKRRVVDEIEPSVGSPSKRARFDPDPDPPPAPAPALKLPLTSSNAHSRPTRIRVHPANSITKQQGTGSFTGSYPPIVVRPAGSSPIRPSRPTGPNSSPSRQQLLLQRPAGPPMRVPVGQQQRTVFPARVASPIRTGSHGSFSSGVAKNVSPAKPRRVEAGSAWPTYPSGPNPKSNPPNHIKPTEVLIAPEHTGSSPVRAGRSSRLPVPRARPGEKMGPISEKPSQVDAPESVSVPPASLTEAGREPTPPTPLETPASPGSSSSTLIMDVPLFYQPPAPRLPPIQQRTAEEIIAEGMEREAQRKREGKTAAAAAAAMRCLPLTRAPRRIIPDGSVLQGWASLASASATGSMTESQKELQKITAANTERNNSYKCVIERTESFVNVPRPPSPTSRVRTKAQKAREEERQSRAERALRRSAARGEDTSASESGSRRQSVALAPGEDSEWTEPVREGRRVRWAQELVRHDMGPSGATSVAAGVGRRCLARTYELDRHGNMCNAQPAESSQGPKVVVTRYVYNDEPGFKAWKREQIPGSD